MGYSTYEDTLTALRLVKDKILQVGGRAKFSITKKLLADVKASYIRYEPDCVAKNGSSRR